MNCRPGDLAIIVMGKPESIGALVECLAWIGGAVDALDGVRVEDCCLRPLRGLGEHETAPESQPIRETV